MPHVTRLHTPWPEFRHSGLATGAPGRVDPLLSMTQSPSTHLHLQKQPLSMVVNGIPECTLGVSESGLPEGQPHTATLDNLLWDTNGNPEGGQLTWENVCPCHPDKGAGPLVRPTQGWESRLCSSVVPHSSVHV